MKKKSNLKNLTTYFNKVQNYISMEYDEKLAKKMGEVKYIDVTAGYIKNCCSINKTVPFAANGIVRLLKNTN